MDTIALLNLPLVLRDRSLKLLQPIELFELSLCSTKALNAVKDLNLSAVCHEIQLNRGSAVISVRFTEGRKILWWDFRPFYIEEALVEERIIDGIVFDKCIKSTQPLINVEEFYCKYPNIEEGMIAVTKHLTQIFKGPIHLNIAPGMFRDLAHFVSQPHLRNVKELEITGDRTVTSRQLAQIFCNISISHKLVIRPETEITFPLEQSLRVDHLELQTASWMTRTHLLKLNCRYAELRDNRFTWQDLEAFAENWRKSPELQLERVWFGWDSQKEFKLDDIDTIRWDGSKRERNYILINRDGTRERVDCENGFDLEREDGSLATFKRDENPLNPGVYFLVWKEKFPEKKRLDELPTALAPYYKQLEQINKDYPNATSLERMLSNPSLKYNEFLDTYHILRSMDHEYHPASVGRSSRRRVFDRIYAVIDVEV